jgi:hypothetical protein
VGAEGKGRGELWATATGTKLHHSPTCCSGAHYVRMQVKAHSNPAYFEDPRFELCRRAKAVLDSIDIHRDGGRGARG